MKIDKDILIARLRQILAADQNAYVLYSDLSARVSDQDLKAKFLEISKDEKRHCVLGQEALSILEK